MKQVIYKNAEVAFDKIQNFETALRGEFDEYRKKFHYSVQGTKVRFEKEIIKQHKRLKIGVLRSIRNTRVAFILTAPVIYAGIVPLLILDFFVTVYQRFCFPIYGIPFVPRGEYIVIDRHKLAYLNIVEKFNCIYCGYGNGLLAYAKEIASRTEQFWCPIKHARRLKGIENRYHGYIDYGDAETYRTHQGLKVRKIGAGPL